MTDHLSDKNRRLPPNVEAEILRLCQGIQTSRTKYETLDVLRHVAEFAILDAQMSAIASPRPSSAATGETPRTDAAITVCRDSVFGNEYVPIAVARQLERELAEAKVLLANQAQAVVAMNSARSSTAAPNTYDVVADAVQEIADAAEEAFKKAGLTDPGEWDSDNIVQDVKLGIVSAIGKLAALRSARAEKIADVASFVEGLDCAHRCGVGKEVADKIRKHFGPVDGSANRG